MKKVESGDCPKCGYFIIKHSLVAECARCDYEDTWDNYNKITLSPLSKEKIIK